MTSWVYVFSRFTPEALLFEALVIFGLMGTYTAFWVLKKRKLGPIESAVPAGVVKTYLNELIVDAHQLRAQLFGLLAGAGVTASPGTASASFVAVTPATGAPDPEALQKLAALEAKMAEQAKAMQAILADKALLEKELAEAKKAGTSDGGGNSAELTALQEKIQNLEGKLAEYSVIEDDLANLKRLQQENAQLRSALGAKGGSVPAPEAAAPAAEPAAPAPSAAEPTPAADPLADVALAAAATPLTEPAATPAADTGFEGLVDQVEQSLQPATPLEAATSTTPAQPDNVGKSDADLVAEFEKMLSG